MFKIYSYVSGEPTRSDRFPGLISLHRLGSPAQTLFVFAIAFEVVSARQTAATVLQLLQHLVEQEQHCWSTG